MVESPKVANGTVIGWNVLWNPSRKFATDMAGFAVDLDVILKYCNYKLYISLHRGLGHCRVPCYMLEFVGKKKAMLLTSCQ